MEDPVIKVGDYVTVTQGKLCMSGGRDGSYGGALLEVLAISGPFVLLREHVSKYGTKSNSKPVLDTRDWTLGLLEQEFIDAMLDAVSQ